jgi:glyoxylase-like metal-dependent hydrolase (beta-lactamase superfamily II)
MRHVILACMACALPVPMAADPLDIQQVTANTWALVGPMTQRDAVNLGNNATFGVILTEAGVVLVDPGGSWLGAQMIDRTLDEITNAPVTHVINTGGQDHRWLGNGYWQAQGAQVIASAAAVADQQDRASVQLSMLSALIGDGLDGTDPAFADVTFDTDHTLETGGLRIEILHRGPAHTPGDAFVWLPDQSVAFAGDIVFTERLLGVQPFSDTRGWLAAFEAMAALAPRHVVPGHGAATTLETARQDTYAYLVNLRSQIGALLDAGGDILEAASIDQQAWVGLAQFDMLAGRNAQATYEAMEWE